MESHVRVRERNMLITLARGKNVNYTRSSLQVWSRVVVMILMNLWEEAWSSKASKFFADVGN